MSINIAKIAATFALAVTLVAPLSAEAFIPFGGKVINITACVAPPGAFLTTVVGARGVFSYLWQPGIPYFRQGPPTFGQSVIGVAAPVPVPCIGFGLLGPSAGAGFPILFLLHGSSAI